ncbi:NAD(P)-dependent oxidoreductase [Furfurilactobacillus siliginis]|uniref:3-hydroxyisobutyrate dehydrogenase n=1 Tax=Furfurilactobacillus siliginis TaxID=348151 RepID=A0A0R2LDT0_9LACO|nr:NAD(P)-dependent oxidoreductase [Furfurilactobacillus siliginis]KRN96404.1 3-hydroxyisobutyrate dehydrogenase [Furfurilactobacillus siliginis]GEK29300.1 oxidoreductase [Furfurilactobacillus siliginis]
MKLGFIGTGVMGAAIVENLLKAGNAVTVYNRTQAKAASLIKQGAKWADSPAIVAAKSEIVLTMVGYPKDVESVYFGEDGVFAGVQPGSIIVDMTTSTPSLAAKIAAAAPVYQVTALDAPVSGGDIGAKEARLTVMVGGEQAAYDRIKPVFEQLGQAIHLFGPAGSGQHAKMANQIMIAGTMTGLTEMLVYAKAAGLNLPDVLATLSAGGADNWSMDNYVPRILKNDYTPGFFAKHFLKDLRIALDEADKMNIDLPATTIARQLYEQLVDERGLGDDGTQALVKLWWS